MFDLLILALVFVSLVVFILFVSIMLSNRLSRTDDKANPFIDDSGWVNCAWCSHWYRNGVRSIERPSVVRGLVSHGMCPVCAERERKNLRTEASA